MRWKSTLILLIVTLGVGAYVSLYELKQPTAKERERQSRYVLNLEPATITQIVLDLPNVQATLTRQGNQWTLAPHKLRADNNLVSQVLSLINPLYAQRVLKAEKDKLLSPKEYGLEPAQGWMSFAADGSVTTLMIGGTTAVGDSRYVKTDRRPEIFVVPGRLLTMLNKPVDSLRDHALLRINSWLCREIALKSASGSWHVVKESAHWQLTEPLADSADKAAIRALLTQMERLAIRKFVRDDPPIEQLANWGLDHPQAELTLVTDDGGKTTVFFGKPLPEDAELVYAKRSDELPLYAVPGSDLRQLLLNEDAVRLKKCFDASLDDVTRVSVRWLGENWTIERKDDGNWTTGDKKTVLDKQRVEAWVGDLLNAGVTSFIDDKKGDAKAYGWDQPAASVSLSTTDGATPQQLRIGAEVPAGSHARYGKLMPRNVTVILPEETVAIIRQARPEQLKAALAANAAASR